MPDNERIVDIDTTTAATLSANNDNDDEEENEVTQQETIIKQEAEVKNNNFDENKIHPANTERLLIINPRSLNSSATSLCRSSSPTSLSLSSVVTLHNARFLNARKTLLLRKALVEEPDQDVLAASSATTTTHATTTDVAISCIRAYASAVNDCEPD